MTLTDRESSSSPSRASSEGSSAASDTSKASNPVVSDSDQDDVVDPICLEWFKDVIKKIKGQKQRPGLDRMIQALKPYVAGTKYDSQSIKKQLALAIRDGHLFKVYSNGEPSYKDTQNLRSLRKVVVKELSHVKRAVKAAVREIGEKDGTDAETIQRYIKYTFEVKPDQDQLKSLISKALTQLTTSAKKELIEQDGRYKHNPSNNKADDKAEDEDDDAEGSRPRSSLSATPRLKDNSEEIPFPPVVNKAKSKKNSPQEVTPSSSGSKRSAVTPAGASPSKTSTPDMPPKKPDMFNDEKTSVRNKSSTPSSISKLDQSLKRKKSQSPEKKSEKLVTPPSSKPPKPVAEVKEKPKNIKPKATDSATVKAETLTAATSIEKKKRGRPFKIKPETSTTETSPARAKARSVEKPKEEKKQESEEESGGSAADEKTTAIFPDADFDDMVPKELRDGLSGYFSLSTVKRKSRVAYNSLLTATVPVTKDEEISEDNEPKPSTSRQKSPPAPRQSLPSTSKSPSTSAVSRKKLASTSRPKSPVRRQKSPDHKPTTSQEKQDSDTPTDSGSDARVKSESEERDGDGTKKRGKKPGSYQLKGLSDQLSRYFTAAPGARQRKPPTHYTPVADKYPKQKVRKAAESTTASDRSESRSGKVSDDGRKSKSTSKTHDASDRSIRVDSPGKDGFRIPDVVPKHFEDLFRQARMKALEKIPTVSADYEGSLPPKIQLGNKKIVTWYTSPFPEEYIRCQCLYLCEFCLQYMKTVKVLKSHYEKCPWHRPPGTEIYRDTVVGEDGDGSQQELVLYETDGNEWKEYCQNLCLLAKLYLDHKTLYYDVEPFLFYVLTSRDKFGDHLIGYFSKEKNCPQRYNVSCIMVLPPYQGGGYGRFLIDFSYLLSRVEGQHGTPEKPLSELGQISYHAYWRSAILDFFLEQRQKSSTKTSIKAICDATGMWPQDVADILQQLNFLVKKEDSNAWEFSLVPDVLDAYFEKKNSGKKRLPIHPDKLNWDPWRGEGMGITSGESDHGESQTEMQLDTNDEAKDVRRSRDTSESDNSQKPATRREDPAPASPPAGRSTVRKSREKTPRGRPGQAVSSSRERSAEQPQSSQTKRSQGRSPRTQDKASSRNGRSSVVSSKGSRRKRKIKFRSGRSSSAKQTTSSQPKNYKGRGEEFRAGAEKRRKRRQREQRGRSSSGSSSSPYRRSSSTTSLSSADESLASEPSSNKHQGKFPQKHSAKNDDSESTSSKSSSSSALSHLDQPPRAPHPQQQIDMMDQGVCTDSPPEFHLGQHVDATAGPAKAVAHHAAEISVQTEPLDIVMNQAAISAAPVIHPQHDYQRERDNIPVEMSVHARASENPGMVQQQQMTQVLPTSPSFPSHLSQPTTPYPVGSPLVSHGSVGQPGSVVSTHEVMSQDSEIMMNPPSYESGSYEHHYTPQSAPAVPATPPTYPAYPPNSPAVAQPLHASVYPTEVSHPASVQALAYGEMSRGAPHTPGSSSQSSGYHHEEVAVNSHPHSPRVMPNPKYNADAYARAASVAPRYVVDPSTIRSQSVAPTNVGQRQQHSNPYSEAVSQEAAAYTAAMYSKPQTSQTSSSSTSRKHRRHGESSGQAQMTQQQQQQQQQHHHMQAMQQGTHPLMFHSPYGHGAPGMMMGFPGMPETVQIGAYASAMQQEPSSLSKLNEFTRTMPAAGQVPSAQYGQHAIAGQRSHQSAALSRQQQQMSHHMPMAVSSGAIPMQYINAGMKNMQNFAGQPPVMNPSYQAAFFGQPLPGQSAGYRPVQAQSLYPYPYVYPTGNPQHGSHGQGSIR